MNEDIQRILINKSKGQLRVAHIDGNNLYDLEIEQADRERKVDSICNAEVVSIEPSLEAAFVNFGAHKNGFLPLKEVAHEFYPKDSSKKGRLSIKDVLFEGQKILIQVNKEERGTKGAALTTYISLAGCYLVLMPNNPKAGGISRRIEGDERDELKTMLNALTIPEEMGVIIRTAGMGKSIEELQWDLDVLINLWSAITEASKSHGAPFLIHQESDVAIRAVRDHLRPDIREILIDDKEVYEKVRAYIERVRPDFIERVKLYDGNMPLFSQCQIESQIESVFQRKVRLPSGGEIVIDRSEALTAIDINSAQSTKGEDIEETALNTNLEASVEIARQLRIRDLGGLFVIDFIDMEHDGSNRKVEDGLRDAFKRDRARVQFGRISRFGLMEMSRQRLRSSLNEAYQVVCPRCHGQGSVRNVQSQSFSILHLIEEKAYHDNVDQIRVQVPVNIATYLLNEQRPYIQNIEAQYGLSVLIIPNPYFEIPEYNIKCIEGASGKGRREMSYALVTPPTVSYESESKKEKESQAEKKEPVVKEILPTVAPTVTSRSKSSNKGLLKRIIDFLFSLKPKAKQKESDKYQRNRRYNSRSSSGDRRYSSQRSSRGSYRRPRRDYRGQEGQRSQPRSGNVSKDGETRETRDNRSTRDNRDTRDSRASRDNRERRDSRGSRDTRDNRDNRGRGRSSSGPRRDYSSSRSSTERVEKPVVKPAVEEPKKVQAPVAPQVIHPTFDVKPADKGNLVQIETQEQQRKRAQAIAIKTEVVREVPSKPVVDKPKRAEKQEDFFQIETKQD